MFSGSDRKADSEEEASVPTYIYELAYTADSIAAQIKNPQDRLEVAAKPVIEATGGKFLAGGFSFGEYDALVVFEAPDDVAAAALAAAVVAGGAIKASRTTKLLDGKQWVDALTKARGLLGAYTPAR
jgi:uncharacterized protein with GYD domain